MFKNYIKKAKGLALNSSKGFTLIEILIVIGIIAILASIVIIAINPAKQFAQARNTQREAAVNTILNAIGQRLADNKGIFAGTFSINSITYTCGTLPTAGFTDITTGQPALTTDVSSALGCLVPTYVSSLPTDPTAAAGATNTLYQVVVGKNCAGADNAGRISVSAPLAANETAIPGSAAICVTR